MKVTVEQLCDILSKDLSANEPYSKFFSEVLTSGESEAPYSVGEIAQAFDFALRVGRGELDIDKVKLRSEASFLDFNGKIDKDMQIYNVYFREKEVDYSDRVSIFLGFASSWQFTSGASNMRLYSKIDSRSLVAILDRYHFKEDVLKTYNEEGTIDVDKTQTMYILKDNGSFIHKHEGIWAYVAKPMETRWMPILNVQREQRFYSNKCSLSNYVEDILMENVPNTVYLSRDPGRHQHMNEDIVAMMRFIKYYHTHHYNFDEVKLFTDVFKYKSHPKNWRFNGSEDILNTYIATLPTKRKRKLASHCAKVIMKRIPRFTDPDIHELVVESSRAATLIGQLNHPRSLDFIKSCVESGLIINSAGNRIAWLLPSRIDDFFETFRNVIIPQPGSNAMPNYANLSDVLLTMNDTLRMHTELGDVVDLTHRNIDVFALHNEVINIYNREMGGRRYHDNKDNKTLKNFEYDKFWKDQETEDIKLLHPYDFYEVGDKLSICIGAYAHQISSSKTRAIFYISSGKEMACIEVSRRLGDSYAEIEQAKLRFNKSVKEHEEIKDIVLKWAKAHKMEITTYDLKDSAYSHSINDIPVPEVVAFRGEEYLPF